MCEKYFVPLCIFVRIHIHIITYNYRPKLFRIHLKANETQSLLVKKSLIGIWKGRSYYTLHFIQHNSLGFCTHRYLPRIQKFWSGINLSHLYPPTWCFLSTPDTPCCKRFVFHHTYGDLSSIVVQISGISIPTNGHVTKGQHQGAALYIKIRDTGLTLVMQQWNMAKDCGL